MDCTVLLNPIDLYLVYYGWARAWGSSSCKLIFPPRWDSVTFAGMIDYWSALLDYTSFRISQIGSGWTLRDNSTRPSI